MSKNNIEKTLADALKTRRENEALAKLMIEGFCKMGAAERYSENLPAQVSKRLKTELKLIFANGFSRHYLLAYVAANRCRERSVPMLARGGAGASFVAFLLGITQTNPLPRHFYCPRCGYFKKRSRPRNDKPGNKLVSNIDCPKCGEMLELDGHDIPFESFAGLNGEKVPSFELAVPAELRDELDEFLAEQLSNDSVLRADEFDSPDYKSSVRLFGVPFLSILNKLQYLTSVSEGARCLTARRLRTSFSARGHNADAYKARL